VFGLAATLCCMIAGMAAMNTYDGLPPRATWIPAFTLVGGLTAILVVGAVVGRMLA